MKKMYFDDGHVCFKFDDILFVRTLEHEIVIYFKYSEKNVSLSYRYNIQSIEKFRKEYREYLEETNTTKTVG